jgi:hypothetical protein
MLNGQRFQFTERDNRFGQTSIMPYLPIILSNGNITVETTGLLDTGASVNVLPYEIGMELGAVWEEQTVPIELSGNLFREPARGLVLSGKVAQFDSVLLAFAWTKLNNIPIILGHMNFFQEFNVCFYRHESEFEVCPRSV